jgi:hypothetical protein
VVATTTGAAWAVRRHLPAASLGAPAGGRIYLQFDGANTVADVFVNAMVGEHRAASPPSASTSPTPSTRRVTTSSPQGDNSASRRKRRCLPTSPAGGLYRDVHLEVSGLHVDSTTRARQACT